MDDIEKNRAGWKKMARSLRELANEAEGRSAPILSVTEDGDLTVDGKQGHCPEPFDDCRPGACNCDGIRDHWRIWHTDPTKPCPRRNTDCDLPFSYA